MIWLSELASMRGKLLLGGHRELLELLDAAEAERLSRQPAASAFMFRPLAAHAEVLDRTLARVRG